MDKRTEFRLVFVEDGRRNLDDWRITLKTTEPKTEDEIKSLVEYWKEVNDKSKEDYSPVDIMDDLCKDKGWSWEDTDYQELVFNIK